MKPTVFFFRGLTTSGRDAPGNSFVRFAPLHQNWLDELTARGINFIPVTGMGTGGLTAMAMRARQFLNTQAAWLNPERPVHLLGHSAGGLIARILEAEAPHGKVLSCVSVATAHRGAEMASRFLRIPYDFPQTNRTLKILGYQVENRQALFQEFTPETILAREDLRREGSAFKGSIVCHCPPAEWCALLQAVNRLPPFRDLKGPSDGLVERDTQVFGQVLAELKIDHCRQVGFFGERYRFLKLCTVLEEFYQIAPWVRSIAVSEQPE